MNLSLTALSPSDVMISGPEMLLQWREKHEMPVPGHEYMPRFKFHQWDGMWMPGKWCRENGDVFEMRCSRGLAPRIIRDLGGQVAFNTAAPEEISEFCWFARAQVDKLRDYQRRALEGVLNEGWARIAFATNAGKGAVIALLALYAKRLGHPVLILCDEIAVFDALQGEIAEWAQLDPSLVRQGVKIPPTSLVTLAMVPTLARRLSDEKKAKSKPWHAWLATMQMVLLDEADKADAATWRSILTAAPNTMWRAGFSGSFPDELYYDLKLDELMGPIIDRASNAEMVERGISAKPCIEVHAFEGTSSLRAFPKDWYMRPAAERRLIIYDKVVGENQARHDFIASLIRPDTPTAIVVNRIEHGRALTLSIPGAVFLDGAVSADERIAVLEDFRLGKVWVIVVTKILDRGTNRMGHTSDLIFASGEGSTTQTLQRIGRGLRRTGGKEFLRLVDVIDRIDTEGADRRTKEAAGYLHGAGRKRLNVYAAEGFEIEVHA